MNRAAGEAGTVFHKETKYDRSVTVFGPIAIDTLGVVISSAYLVLIDLGRRITNTSG